MDNYLKIQGVKFNNLFTKLLLTSLETVLYYSQRKEIETLRKTSGKENDL